MNGFGPYPLNIGTLFEEGYTLIGVPEECDAWMIRKHNFFLRPHFLPEYDSWEDTGFESALYNPDRPAEIEAYDTGWADFPFKVKRVEIYTTRKEAKTVCRCIFKANGNEKEITRYL